MLESSPFHGLVAATFTPFDGEGSILFDRITPYVDYLVDQGISAIYICGSTGEGPSLSLPDRMEITQAFVQASAGRLRTLVHIGHTCLDDIRELAAHAASLEVDAISSVAPYYFKPDDTRSLIRFFEAATEAAPSLPFYYYHIPGLTGVSVDPVAFLEESASRLPTLRGIKFTDSDLSRLIECQKVAGGAFDVLFGRDEMLLSGLATGIQGAIGSTYNLAPALYHALVDAFARGDLGLARKCQERSIRMIRLLLEIGGEAAIKYPMHRHGFDCGPRRLPMKQLSTEEKQEIDRQLNAIGFDEWATLPSPSIVTA